MKRIAVILAALLLAGCITRKAVEPINTMKVVDTHCDLSRMDPKEYRNLKEGYAVPGESYAIVRAANERCRVALGEAARANEEIARVNKPDSRWEDFKEAAPGWAAFLLGVLAALAAL